MGARGSAKVAVPTCTAAAPAIISSTASAPEATPPTPTMGMSGRAEATSWTARTATGCRAAPLTPPPEPPSTDRRVSMSMTRPGRVLVSTTASAPPAAAAAATSAMPGPVGLSLAQRGRPQPEVAAITASTDAAECENMRLPSSVLGHETLTSTATTDGGAGASSSAARRYSSTVMPQMLATTSQPVASSPGRSSSSQRRTPGPWRPTLLIMPAATGCSRGAGLPGQGSACRDFTTMAPSFSGSR